jgi:FKBP-type peptidyl-prolyl cis-trans isomerase FklB
MKQFIVCAFSALCFLSANAQVKKNDVSKKSGSDKKGTTSQNSSAGMELKTPIDSFSYAVGMNIGENLKREGITDLNLFWLMKAFDDVLNSKPELLKKELATMTLQQKLQEYNAKKTLALKSKGIEYCAKNKTRKEVTTLPDGMQYEILTAGDPNGIKPTPADTVVVDYVGTLIDGTEFDNSFKRGEPASFPLGGVIKGWTEILQLMTKGAHWKVVIPSELAYGERGAGSTIPPHSTLIFEITLRDIKAAATK